MIPSTQVVDEFAGRLAKELAMLPRPDRDELIIRIGRMEARMRADGQERPVWRGPVPEPGMLGADVVVPTDTGERRGRVIAFGIARAGIEYERSVVVFSAASGTHHEAPGSLARLASPGETERILEELAMARRLKEATAGQVTPPRPVVPRRKWERAPDLVSKMVELATASDHVRSVTEVGGCHKVEGASGRRLYIHKKGLRVDASGWEPDGPGVTRISAEDARRAHLGKVRGQVDFTDKDVGTAAFVRLLGEL